MQEPGRIILGRFQPELKDTYEDLIRVVTRIQAMEKAFLGLTTLAVRRLVYDFAEKIKIPHRFFPHNKNGWKRLACIIHATTS